MIKEERKKKSMKFSIRARGKYIKKLTNDKGERNKWDFGPLENGGQYKVRIGGVSPSRFPYYRFHSSKKHRATRRSNKCFSLKAGSE